MAQKLQMVKLAALAALAAAAVAAALGAGAFKVTFTYENGVVKMVDPQGGVHTVALNLKEGVKKVEIRLLPNGSAVVLEGGRPIAIIKKIVMRGGEARRVEFRLLPNGTLLVIDGGKVWSKGRIERRGGGEGASQAGEKPSPDIIKSPQPISGSLPPGTGDSYGPYTGLINIEFSVSWSPTGYLCLGYVDLKTGSGPGICSYGQRASASFSLDPSQNIIAVVYNPNSYSITYSGTLTLYYQ
ncbi:hypothetical protein [Pyrobaculum sp.]|uniref:hypothetical protein n=1 Tax=Pyrobaculum sp. TaxID=2004705 RepID=UPI003D0DC793